MKAACQHCGATEHHVPSCPEMSFPSGRRRDDPGPPPKRSMTHQEEMDAIFGGTTEEVARETPE